MLFSAVTWLTPELQGPTQDMRGPFSSLSGHSTSSYQCATFPEPARPLPRVSAGRADCDTVLYWDDLEPADVYKPEIRQFSFLRPRRRRHFRRRPSSFRDDHFTYEF